MAVAREGIKKRDNIMKLYVFSEDAFEHICHNIPTILSFVGFVMLR